MSARHHVVTVGVPYASIRRRIVQTNNRECATMVQPQRRTFVAVAVVVFALLLVAVAPIPAVVGQTALLSVTATTVPANPEPGTTGSIQFVIKNGGTLAASLIEIRLRSVGEGIVISGTDIAKLGSLGAGQTTTVSPFTYYVPLDTPPSVYLADFGIDYFFDTGGTRSSAFQVVGTTLTVKAPSALRVGPLEPAQILPGQQLTLALTLRNTANTSLTSIQGSWSDASNTIVPLGSGNEVFVASIPAKDAVFVPVEVAVPAGAKAGLYSLVFTLNYADSGGTAHAAVTTFSMLVDTPALLSVALDEWRTDSITLSVSNVGIGPAAAVEVRLLPDGPLSSRPASAVFLGNLDPGDHTTATFSPVTAIESAEDALLAVQLAFTDAQGQRQVQQHDLDLGEAPETDGGVSGFLMASILIIALLGVAAYFVWRRRKKNAAGGS